MADKTMLTIDALVLKDSEGDLYQNDPLVVILYTNEPLYTFPLNVYFKSVCR